MVGSFAIPVDTTPASPSARRLGSGPQRITVRLPCRNGLQVDLEVTVLFPKEATTEIELR